MNGRDARVVLSKARAFLKRDFRIASSYQLDFVLTSLNSLFILTLLFFIGRMVDPRAGGLQHFDGGYFAFALIGYAFYQYFQLALTSFSNALQREQWSGCLEAMVGTRTPAETSILLSSLYGILSSLLQLLLILLLGAFLFGVDLSRANLPAALLSFAFSVVIFMGFGILSAAFLVVLKKGDPVTWLITTLNFVFGGAFFPREQMPSWMRTVSALVPATYSLDTLRASLITGAGIADLAVELAVLAAMALLLLPAALSVFRASVRRAKREGTLTLY